MPEYIEREALLKKACELRGGSFSTGLIVEQIEKAPAADVAEVVRCGQCQNWKINPNNLYGGYCRYCESASIDHFCSYGKRKDQKQ